MSIHHAPPARADRRIFLQQGGLAAAGVATLGVWPMAQVPAIERGPFSAFGIVAPLARAAELKAAGADYLVDRVADFLMPNASDADFEPHRERAAAAPIPVRGCNVFLSGPALRCVGPDVDRPRILAYAETAFRRFQSLGGQFICFGSGGARRIPDGWSKAQADEQFITLLTALAPLAERYGMVIPVEQLRSQECNYLTRLSEVVAVVKAVNHPRIRVLADLYHMGVMGDGPEEMGATAPYLAMVEIAEKVNRMVPGVAGDDFRPYFRAIRANGYTGPITIEGNGSIEQIRTAFATIAAQARELK
ncbi:MAG: sugar phosphate isomerase/epimerase family protein [Vicinamibacteraceae bacterium]